MSSAHWKALAALIVVWNWKAIPFVYHVRCLAPFAKVQYKNYLTVGRTSDYVAKDVFELVKKYSFVADGGDCDMFGFHKSGGTYLTDIDIVRCFWLADVFRPALFTMDDFFPTASVSLYFLKQIAPFARYDIEINVLTFDSKSLYLLCRFVSEKKKGKRSNKKDDKDSTSTSDSTSDSNSEEVVHCLALLKLAAAGFRKRVDIIRLLAYCGFGKNGQQNWAHSEKLIKKGKASKWLRGEDVEGIEFDLTDLELDTRRIEALKLMASFPSPRSLVQNVPIAAKL